VYQEFFSEEAAEGADNVSQGTAHQTGLATSTLKLSTAQTPVPPDMFQLVENYRSHQSIVQLAHSLVQALMYFFPYTVDKLNPESSHLSGE
jgi:hypothetical protein